MTTQTQKPEWFFLQKNEEIKVPLEAWSWHVVYKDGTQMHQFDRAPDTNGKYWFHQFNNIDQTKVIMFEMVSTKDPRLRFSIDVTKEMSQIFCFYRRSRLEVGTENEKHITFYVFGYVLGGKSVYHFILPDNRMVISLDRNLKLL